MKIRKLIKVLVNLFVLSSLIVGIFSSSVSKAQVPPTSDGPAVPTATAAGNWYIIELDKPSLAIQAQSKTQTNYLNSFGKLNVNSSASQGYINELAAEQAAFTTALKSAIPGAFVSRTYQVVLNAVAVQLPDSDPATIQALATLPGVKTISPQQIYTISLDYSLPLINASALWDQLDGRANAGKGIKVADIDTGIDPNHVMFNGTGWSYPATGTWPKGYCAEVSGFCNGKIISARFYPPTFDVSESEELTPRDHAGHGSHTAGIAAGNVVTATYGTSTPVISGVAPGAWLMVYKGLFATPSGGSGSNIMLAAAVEDAILDGADVINNSWGSTTIVKNSNDPLVRAYEAAVDAGIVVVFSNGNSGPSFNTSGSPGGESEKFIAVGASTSPRAYYNTIMVTDTVPVSPTIQSFPGNQLSSIAPSAMPTTDIGPLHYVPTDLTGAPIIDTDIYSATGWIALIPRGTYSFHDKLVVALSHGASGAVIYNNAAGTGWKGGFTAGGAGLYAVMISKELGLTARSWWTGHPDTAEMIIGYPASPWLSETPNVIASFSSRGPNIELGIKPDVTAPGVNILSGYWDDSFQVLNGTSMSAPHVTGAAALLLEEHPEWTPAQVKSALMSTASQTILNLDETTISKVMTQGAGIIDLSKAGDPGLTFDEPSYSFGMLPQGSSDSVMINAKDVAGVDEIYSVSVQETISETGLVTVTTSTDSLNMEAGGTGAFTVTVDVGASAIPQDLEGNIVISGTTHLAHIPYWVRVIPAGTGDVLLVDFDESEATDYGFTTIYGGPFNDYTHYYTSTIEAMGLTYDYWNMWDAMALPRSVLDQYDKVVIWTGDYGGFLRLGSSLYLGDSLNQNELRTYLASGGKLLFTGQQALGDYYDRYYGYGPIDKLQPYMRGASNAPLKDGVFPATIPQPSVVGMEEFNPFLKGMILDLSIAGDGAKNQTKVDEVHWVNYIDLDTGPLFEVVNTVTGIVENGYVGTRSSYEPTIERVKDPIGVPEEPVSWRVAELNFGLEGVNNDTGFNSRQQLMQALFNWQDDVVTVAFGADSYFAPAPFKFVNFTASMTSSESGSALYYRWDFGDGSDIVVTASPAASHQYQKIGTYQAYVEVIDSFSHKAVSMPVTVVVGYHIYLPIILNHP